MRGLQSVREKPYSHRPFRIGQDAIWKGKRCRAINATESVFLDLGARIRGRQRRLLAVFLEQQLRDGIIRLRSAGNHRRAENLGYMQSAIAAAFPTGLPEKCEDISAAAADFSDEVIEALKPLTLESFKYPDNLTDLLFAYVSKHPEEFGELPNAED
jgi:hypothetical protein